MALVTRFDTPASLRDLPAGHAFYTDWHNYLAGELSTRAGSGTATGEFYDASEINVDPIAEHTLVWMGFPRTQIFNHRDDRRAAFIVGDADVATRNLQNEYCEWYVKRNAAGKITKVTFVTETPEYWQRLWNANRARVVQLYQELVSTAVVEADLRMPGPGFVYDKFNRWNTVDGIVHFIQGINTLGDAVSLSEGSVGTGAVRDNYEASAIRTTSVDPRVVLDIGSLARRGLSITLREPIGLYIVGYDDTGWTKPNGRPVGNYWRIRRGAPDLILRLEYAVPSSEGFVVGDIRIGGRRIEWGGQIAEHVTCKIGGIAGRRAR